MKTIVAVIMFFSCVLLHADQSEVRIGNVTCSLLKGWKLENSNYEDGLSTATLRNGDDDLFLITYMPGIGAQINTEKELKGWFYTFVKEFEENSISGKALIESVQCNGKICLYANVSDKRLVGKPVIPDDWKHFTTGLMKMGDSTLLFTYFSNEKTYLKDNKWFEIVKTIKEDPGFSYIFKEENVKIIIPEIPEIKLEVHSLNKSRKHLRYYGENKPFILSIMTPTIDKGMTAEEFSRSKISSYAGIYDLTKEQLAVYKQPDGKSFSLYYYIQSGSFLQFHAHLFSINPKGTHAIEVHVSKVDIDKSKIKEFLKGIDTDDKIAADETVEAKVKAWFKGFPSATIQEVN